MTAAILEIRDGMAVGPLHHPAPAEGNSTIQDALSWTGLCGVTGYVYQREGLVEMGYTAECFECVVEAPNHPLQPSKPKPRRRVYNPGPRKYATDEERHAALRRSQKAYYERTKHLRKPQPKGVCRDCGGETSWAEGAKGRAPKRCLACHLKKIAVKHGTASCYSQGCRRAECREAKMAYQRERREKKRAA